MTTSLALNRFHALSPLKLGLLGSLCFFIWILFLQTANQTRNFDPLSLRLVTDSLDRAAKENNIHFAQGFMIFTKENQQENSPREQLADLVYYSQFGLQYQASALALRSLPVPEKWAIPFLKGINILLCSLVLGSLSYWCAKHFGSVAWGLFVAQMLGSVHFYFFSSHLYWCAFFFLLPLTLFLNAYPSMRCGKRWGLLLLAQTTLITLKSLTGYEYLSCLALAAAAPILYYEVLNGAKPFAILSRVIQVGIASVLGFGIALGLHIRQAAQSSGLEVLLTRIQENLSKVAEHNTDAAAGFNWINLIRRYTIYVFNDGVIAMGAVTLILLILLRKGQLSLQPIERRASTAFVIASLVASLSWNSIMWGHMSHHPHLNAITFYMAWYPVAFLITARIVAETFFPQVSSAPPNRLVKEEVVGN